MTSTSWDVLTPTHRCQKSGLAEVEADLEIEDAKRNSKKNRVFSWTLKDPKSDQWRENRKEERCLDHSSIVPNTPSSASSALLVSSSSSE